MAILNYFSRTAFLAAVALLTALPAFAQTAAWDSTFRPGSYDIKVQQFRSYPNSANDVIFLGNSITAGTDWNELLGSTSVRNRGISGDITFGVLDRLDEVTEGKPSRVFILIGINDISRNVPDEVILSNYRKIIRRIRSASPQTRIFCQTLLPVNSSFGKFKNHYGKDEHILNVNRELKVLARNENVTLIDLYPAFLDGEGRLHQELTHDGLHLTAAGYRRWADLLIKGGYLE